MVRGVEEAVWRHHRRTSRPAVTSCGLRSSSEGSTQPRSLPGLSARARNIRYSRPAAWCMEWDHDDRPRLSAREAQRADKHDVNKLLYPQNRGIMFL